MELHFDQELAQLKEKLLLMSSLTEQNVALAIRALVERDDMAATKVERDDDLLDKLEIEIDGLGIRLLALRQPKASDLRLITTAMKISTDLERMGDRAVTIARRAVELNKEPELKPLVDIPRMAAICQSMIRDTLDAFVYQKTDLARQMIQHDNEVDQLNRKVQGDLTELMLRDSQTIVRGLKLMRVAQSLERIGDHTANIAEEIVYLYEARDIRHHQENVAV
ncbi:MAG: phosphate signaling complex protein PhoU [Verrucomicrobiia bacterium]